MKIKLAVDRVTDTLKAWSCTEGIAAMDYQDDVYDPYFFISLDVYITDSIPKEEERRLSFSYTGAFEAGTFNRKDRFMYNDIPFRIEYKRTARFEQVIDHLNDPEASIRDSGTYPLHRFVHSQILFDRSGWIAERRKAIEQLSDTFWQGLRADNQAKMEHYLNDIGAAAIREDMLFFTVSSSGFLKSMFSTLYAINKRLEPSTRFLSTEIYQLPVLPDSFKGMLDTFLRSKGSSLSQRREVAEIMTKHVIHLR